jgi:hypothetical protein
MIWGAQGCGWAMRYRTLFGLSAVCAVSVCACEMFVGEFVESPQDDSNDPEPPKPCAVPYSCDANGTLKTCTVISGQPTPVVKAECGAKELCDDDRGECWSCPPNAVECDGESLRQCDAAGNEWTPGENCAASSKKCDPATKQCLVNDSKCESGAGNSRAQCQSTAQGREWVPSSCGSFPCRTIDEATAYCEQCTGTEEPGCVRSEETDVSTTVRECSADLRWVITPCPTNFVCVAGQCIVQ